MGDKKCMLFAKRGGLKVISESGGSEGKREKINTFVWKMMEQMEWKLQGEAEKASALTIWAGKERKSQ